MKSPIYPFDIPLPDNLFNFIMSLPPTGAFERGNFMEAIKNKRIAPVNSPVLDASPWNRGRIGEALKAILMGGDPFETALNMRGSDVDEIILGVVTNIKCQIAYKKFPSLDSNFFFWIPAKSLNNGVINEYKTSPQYWYFLYHPFEKVGKSYGFIKLEDLKTKRYVNKGEPCPWNQKIPAPNWLWCFHPKDMSPNPIGMTWEEFQKTWTSSFKDLIVHSVDQSSRLINSGVQQRKLI